STWRPASSGSRLPTNVQVRHGVLAGAVALLLLALAPAAALAASPSPSPAPSATPSAQAQSSGPGLPNVQLPSLDPQKVIYQAIAGILYTFDQTLIDEMDKLWNPMVAGSDDLQGKESFGPG